ncbi:hemolysin family protein [Photobacterium damselae]
MEIAILIGLILLNGVFAMAEIALVTAKRSRLQRLAEDGKSGAQTAINLGTNPTRFLSTIQIGITAIGLLNGIYGESALAGPMAQWLIELGMHAKTASIASTAIVVLGITYLSIVLGELVPKRLGQYYPEAIAQVIAKPISFLASVSKPFVWLLSLSTEGFLALMGKRGGDGQQLTEEDIEAVIAEGSESGVLEKQEHDMVKNVLHFDRRKISSLLTPRNDLVYIDLEQGQESNLQKILAAKFTSFPVCKGGIENIQGFITAKQYLQFISHPDHEITDFISAPVFVPENWTGPKLLELFKQSGNSMVFVVDEYGDLQGIVTPKDILEALAGEFNIRNPEDVWSVQNADNSWTMDGLLPIAVLKELLELKSLPDEKENGYHTLSGMIMWQRGELPKPGDCIYWQGWRFEVVAIQSNRVDRVFVRHQTPSDIKQDQFIQTSLDN